MWCACGEEDVNEVELGLLANFWGEANRKCSAEESKAAGVISIWRRSTAPTHPLVASNTTWAAHRTVEEQMLNQLQARINNVHSPNFARPHRTERRSRTAVDGAVGRGTVGPWDSGCGM